MSAIPRVVVSAPSSGHGKTAISVGLLAAYAARGMRPAGFKVGPDYVDAAYLGLAAGRPGRNLDPRLVGANRLGTLFGHGAAGADIAVVEGTMGLFDGLAGRTDAESTAQVAGLLRAPVVLVVDVAAMGQSVAALVHGFRAYDELTWLGGVILNRIDSDRHEQVLREALDDIGVPVLGALRRRALSGLGPHGAPLPPRHEGVGPIAQGSLDAARAVRRLGEVIARYVDLERLIALARSAPRLSADAWSPQQAVLGEEPTGPPGATSVTAGRRPLVAVAGGPRLTFGYVETVELLAAAGADVVTVDPVRDQHLPDGVDALIVGGGLPEAYAEDLSVNESLRRAVAGFARSGRPVAAEGTGLVWLCREFAGRPMCGVIDASARVGDLIVLGYRQATAVTSSVLLPAGARAVGHKLHRTVVVPRAGQYPAWSWHGGPAEGFVGRWLHASYLSLHWAGLPEMAARFVAAARSSSGAGVPLAKQPAGTQPVARPAGPAETPEPAAGQPAAAAPVAVAVLGEPAPVATVPPAAAAEPAAMAAEPVTAVGKPAVVEPAVGKPAAPDSAAPDSAAPDSAAPDSAAPGSVALDSAVLDSAAVESAVVAAAAVPVSAAPVPATPTSAAPATDAADYSVDLGVGAASDPVSGAASRPVSGGVADPVSGAASRPVSGGVADPVSGAASRQVSGAASRQVSGAASRPVSGGVADPVSGAGGHRVAGAGLDGDGPAAEPTVPA